MSTALSPFALHPPRSPHGSLRHSHCVTVAKGDWTDSFLFTPATADVEACAKGEVARRYTAVGVAVTVVALGGSR